MTAPAGRLRGSDVAFWAAFALYTVGALAVLGEGLLAVAASVSDGLHEALRGELLRRECGQPQIVRRVRIGSQEPAQRPVDRAAHRSNRTGKFARCLILTQRLDRGFGVGEWLEDLRGI
jgi:hypothetical protein